MMKNRVFVDVMRNLGRILVPLSLLVILVLMNLNIAAPAAAESEVQVHKIQTFSDDGYATEAESLYRLEHLFFPYSTNERLAFLRWPLMVRKGADISSATLRVRAKEAGDASPTVVRLHLVDSDDSQGLEANPINRPVTDTSVDWELPGEWTAGEWYASVDLGPIIQEFVNRPGYQYGNALCLRASNVSGMWKRIYTWDHDPGDGAELSITYAGGVADLELYMADPEVRIAQKIYAQIKTPSPTTDRLQARLDGQIIFEKNSDLQPEEIFVADYRELRAGSHELVVSILDENGMELAVVTKRWTTLHNGVPKVGINENNAICVDGKPFFPITPFMLDPSKLEDWPYSAPLDMGSNINTLYVEGYYPEHTVDTWAEYIQTGYTKGFLVGGPGRWEGFNSEDPRNSDSSKLVDYVERTKDLPGLFAWNWDDEPNLGSEELYNTAENVRHWMELTHAHDTNHPVWNLYYGYDFTHQDSDWHNSRIKEYSYLYNEHLFGEKTVVSDVVSFDYYPYEYATWQDWVSLEDYTLALDRAQEWNYNLLPVATCIETQDLHDANAVGHEQACGWAMDRAWTPGPTPEQLKNLIWVSIVHGAKAIQYFQYFCPIPQENMVVLQETKAWIEDLTPVILGPEEPQVDVQDQEIMGGRIDTMVRELDGKVYIFATNLKEAQERSRFSVPGLSAGTAIQVYGEGRTITAVAGAFEDDFDPLGVHIYIWSLDAEQPTFADVPFDHWAHDYIEVLYQEGYVAGCSTEPLLYCPEQIMTRAESAVFVERGVHGTDYLPVQPTEQIFADVPLHEWFAKWSTALWEDGYTDGCGTNPLIYCPLQEHTRTEGCVFFLRMMHGVDYVPPDPEGMFVDVPLDWWGAKWVEAAYNAGLIPACETDPELMFCPDDPLDRAMGAYMMVQAKGLE